MQWNVFRATIRTSKQEIHYMPNHAFVGTNEQLRITEVALKKFHPLETILLKLKEANSLTKDRVSSK